MSSSFVHIFPRKTTGRAELLSWSSWLLAGGLLCLLVFQGAPTAHAAVTYDDQCVLYMKIGHTDSNNNFSPFISKNGNCSNEHGSPTASTYPYLQGTLYLTLPDDATAASVGQDLLADEVIENYTQPFTGIALPEIIRVYFDEDEYSNEAMSYYIAHNYSSAEIEEIPKFGGSSLPPNDPELPNQWYLDYLGFNESRYYCGEPTRKVKIAVVDNGFDTDHPDLAPQISKEIDAAHNDGDASVVGTSEGHNHGTLAAGLVGAATNNHKGIASVSNNNIEMLVIKASSDSAKGSDVDHGLEAVAKAIEEEVDIISISRGAFGADFPIFRKVLQKAFANDIIVVASAGNYSSSEKFYPAAYDEVIAVASVNEQGKKSWFTNFGPRVDIAAPGENILTTNLGGTYTPAEGTSQATPLVAGAIGFAMSRGMSVSDLFAALEQAPTDDIGEGILNMRNLCEQPACEITYPQLDYNDDGKLDDKDLKFLRSQYLGDLYFETCDGKRYGEVCCPDGYYCDLNVDGKVGQTDAIYRLRVRLGYINFDICGDFIDNDCDGQNDRQEPACNPDLQN